MTTHPRWQHVCGLTGVARSATNDSARDVRAADLQEDLVKPVRGMDLASKRSGFTRPDEDGGDQRTSPRASEQSNRARVRAQHQEMGEAPVKYELPGAS